MKEKMHLARFLLVAGFVFCLSFVAKPYTVLAAEITAQTVVNRPTGECSFQVDNLDYKAESSLKLEVFPKDGTTASYQKEITLTSENCENGTYKGTFSLSDVAYTYGEYTVKLTSGSTTVTAGTCDFSIHTSNISMSMSGKKSSASRTITIASTEPTDDVIVPGKDNKISAMAWTKSEEAAVEISDKVDLNSAGMTLPADITKAGTSYGKWNIKVVVTNADNKVTTLLTSSYNVAPSQSTFQVVKSSALEKKKAFGISLTGLKNAYGVTGVSFKLYNGKGKKVATVAGIKQNTSGTKYYAEVKFKTLNYIFDTYTVKATITDNNGKTKTLAMVATADMQVTSGSLVITKNSDATTKYKLSNAYIPGNIKKVEFITYQVKGDKFTKINTTEVKNTAGKKTISCKIKNAGTGNYKIVAYGYTTWGKKVEINTQTYRLRKKDMGKNGWFYEKYNGKKYKFYYVDNEKLTDLTKVLKLEKSSGTHTNNFYIEVNRAACTVTIYMYNSETKKYDIPVKTCTVCVGRDVSSTGGAGGLNENTSYTPLGNYSICTNGVSVKYSLKEMHEPDGSICYARWATHIVGNVYFHSIAVGTPSHNALPSYRFNLLGSPASAGCIRMAVADAKWIYDYASTGSKVKIVKGDSKKPGPLGKISMPKSNGVSYDPTDPSISDSQKKKDYAAKRITGYLTKKGIRVGY